MSSEIATRLCTSNGCSRPTRMRPFKGSKKLYAEGTCRACQGTMRRYGITAPERDKRKQMGVELDPLLGAFASHERKKTNVKSNDH